MLKPLLMIACAAFLRPARRSLKAPNASNNAATFIRAASEAFVALPNAIIGRRLLRSMMTAAFSGLLVHLSGLTAARAETAAQKLRYIKALTGVSCSSQQRLVVHLAPNRSLSTTLPAPAYVTVIRGRLDPQGNSWLFVSNDNTRKAIGWVKLRDLNCI